MNHFDYLMNHSNFIEKWKREDHVIYLFEEGKYRYEILINDDLENGPTWDIYIDGEYDEKMDIWDTPYWYRKLYHDVTEDFFKKNRVKMIFNHEKRFLRNVAFSCTLILENGKDVFNSFYFNRVTENLVFEKSDDKELAYSLYKMMKEKENNLYFYLDESHYDGKPKNEYQISRRTKEEFENEYWKN